MLVHPLLQPEARQQPGEAAAEDDQRQPPVVLPDRFPRLFDRVGRERVDLPVAGRVGALRGADERRSDRRTPPSGRRCAGGGAVRVRHQCPSDSLIFASGAIVRISKIEIIGRNRMNRKNSVRNIPIVPMNVIQSQIVG